MKKLLLILLIFFSFSQISFANVTEEEKIRWHLFRTENVLRKVNTTNLNENQVINRLKNLDILHQYALDGDFPNNDKFPGESRPFFRGSNGNLCAVGFLMYQDGEYRDYVDNIVETNNLVEVMDIKEGKIFNWLDENGFTQLEAAMIQPSYGPCGCLSDECLAKCWKYQCKIKGDCNIYTYENILVIMNKNIFFSFFLIILSLYNFINFLMLFINNELKTDNIPLNTGRNILLSILIIIILFKISFFIQTSLFSSNTKELFLLYIYLLSIYIIMFLTMYYILYKKIINYNRKYIKIINILILVFYIIFIYYLSIYIDIAITRGYSIGNLIK